MGLFDLFRSRAEDTASSGGIPPTSPWSDAPPAWLVNGAALTVFDGFDDLEVVGESRYQAHLRAIVGEVSGERVRSDIEAVLVAEHGNPYDDQAISVWIEHGKVGHLSRQDAQLHRRGLLELQATHRTGVALAGVIVGGGLDDDGRARMLGVFLSYDRTEFGLAPLILGSRHSDDIRTGLSVAVATDEEDDDYDLGWRTTLSVDSGNRVRQVRALLGHEADPISRHYLFTELECSLYKLRDSRPSALDEYDIACVEHDAEMDVIRPALLAKFGAMPLLDTYRQAAIRQHNVGNTAGALRWAERGLELYGDAAIRPEAVEDLQKRAARYRKVCGRPQEGDGR